jgi:hypothetical protein
MYREWSTASPWHTTGDWHNGGAHLSLPVHARRAAVQKRAGGAIDTALAAIAAQSTRVTTCLCGAQMSTAKKPSMVSYPMWAFEIPVAVPREVMVLGEQGTYLNAMAKSLLEGAEALLKAPSGGSDSPLEAVVLLEHRILGGVDTALRKLAGPTSASASASASKDVVGVVLIFAGEGRLAQVVLRSINKLVDKSIFGSPSQVEAIKAHCARALRGLTARGLVHDLEGTYVHNVCWAKARNGAPRRQASSLESYLLGRAETGAHGATSGPADPVATAELHLRLGLDVLGPSKARAMWESSSGSSGSSGSKRPVLLLQQGEGGGKKAREGTEAAPPAPATHPNPDPEPRGFPDHSNTPGLNGTCGTALAAILSWEGALTGPTARERARDILKHVADVTEENARLRLELEYYKAQDALRAKV